MSARAERRRCARAMAKPPEDIGICAGWAPNAETLPVARSLLHDQVIALMGDRRTGPVQWVWGEGAEGLDLFAALMGDATAATSESWSKIGGLLAEHGGFIVIAMAEGRRPHG